MAVSVSVRSYTHSVTYVADNVLRSVKDIIRGIGLDPSKFVADWHLFANGLKTWITSGHLTTLHLEVYNPRTNALVDRWDISISYAYSDGDGSFWTDTDAIRYAIAKTGVAVRDSHYTLVLTLKPGYAKLSGWSDATLRSTAGFVEQRIGTAIDASGLGAGVSYFRRV